MVTFSSSYIEPGAYAEYKPTTTFVAIPGVLRVPAFVGAGKETIDVIGEAVTHDSIGSADAVVADDIIAILKVYENNVNGYKEYVQNIDYKLTDPNTVDWSLKASLTSTEDLSGGYTFTSGTDDTFKYTIEGGVEQTITFGSGAKTLAQIVTAIDAGTGISATAVDTKYIKLTVEADAQITSISIGNGTSNGILGFISGTYVSSEEPAADAVYFVDYERPKVATDIVPTYYFSLNDIVTAYGDPNELDDDDVAINTLSLAAQIAFEHGSNVVLLKQCAKINTDDETIDDFNVNVSNVKTAIDTLKEKDLTVIVPLFEDSSVESNNSIIRQYLKTHCEQMSTVTQRKYRTGIVHCTRTAIDDVRAISLGLNTRKIVMTYPSQCSYTLDSGTVSVPGYFISAAVAGLATSQSLDPAEPLTQKVITGFTEIVDNKLRSEKNYIASAGVCIIEFINFSYRIRHCLTTSQTGKVEDQEYTCVETLDFIAETSMKLLESLLVGTKLLPATLSFGATALNIYFNTLVERAIINGIKDLSVKQDSNEPRQVDVTFKVRLVYPLNWVYISFQVAP